MGWWWLLWVGVKCALLQSEPLIRGVFLGILECTIGMQPKIPNFILAMKTQMHQTCNFGCNLWWCTHTKQRVALWPHASTAPLQSSRPSVRRLGPGPNMPHRQYLPSMGPHARSSARAAGSRSRVMVSRMESPRGTRRDQPRFKNIGLDNSFQPRGPPVSRGPVGPR